MQFRIRRCAQPDSRNQVSSKPFGGPKTAIRQPMKLRIHDNSIRLRLTRSEVARFTEAGRIEATLQFGPGAAQRMTYGLEISPGIAGLRASGSAEHLIIRVAPEIAKEWTTTDRVAISGEQSANGATAVSILVEKEFRRLHGAKYNPDLYPNPLEATLSSAEN